MRLNRIDDPPSEHAVAVIKDGGLPGLSARCGWLNLIAICPAARGIVVRVREE
jgi:hypothetical protein